MKGHRWHNRPLMVEHLQLAVLRDTLFDDITDMYRRGIYQINTDNKSLSLDINEIEKNVTLYQNERLMDEANSIANQRIKNQDRVHKLERQLKLMANRCREQKAYIKKLERLLTMKGECKW